MDQNHILDASAARDGDYDALVALTAFNGAVIGAVVSCCAALAAEPDQSLSLFAGLGALGCIALWQDLLTYRRPRT